MLSTVHRLGTEVYLKRKKVLIDAQLLKIYKKTKNYSDTKSFNNTDTLDAALKHTLLQGGKRIRPILAIATYELYGSDPNAIMGPACALELIHTGSLMLDDLPSMDNAQYRRGVKTSHSQYGEATTILASAALWVKAFDFLAAIDHVRINDLVHQTVTFVGEEGLILGQYLDLFLLDKIADVKELERSYELKTSALFRLAVKYGGYLGGASQADMQLLDTYARHLGVAFQIRDDIIDATQTLEQSGKDAHKDELNHKTNYVSLLGLAGAKQELAKHITAATSDIDLLNKDTKILADIATKLAVA